MFFLFQNPGFLIFLHALDSSWLPSCGMGAGLLGIGKRRPVFKLRFWSFFSTINIFSLDAFMAGAWGSPSSGCAIFSAAISWSFSYFFLGTNPDENVTPYATLMPEWERFMACVCVYVHVHPGIGWLEHARAMVHSKGFKHFQAGIDEKKPGPQKCLICFKIYVPQSTNTTYQTGKHKTPRAQGYQRLPPFDCWWRDGPQCWQRFRTFLKKSRPAIFVQWPGNKCVFKKWLHQ